jgi:mRNA interferase MazF
MRPVLILKKFNKNICLVAPTSTKIKDNKYYFKIEYKQTQYSLLVSQIRVIDTKRFKKKIAQLSTKDLTLIKDYFAKTLF